MIVRYTSTSMYVQSTEYCCVGVALVWNKLPGIDPHVRLQGVLRPQSVLRTSLSCKSVTFADVDFQQESGVVFFLKCLRSFGSISKSQRTVHGLSAPTATHHYLMDRVKRRP